MGHPQLYQFLEIKSCICLLQPQFLLMLVYYSGLNELSNNSTIICKGHELSDSKIIFETISSEFAMRIQNRNLVQHCAGDGCWTD